MNWRLPVVGLLCLCLASDYLARRGRPYEAFFLGVLNAAGWAWYLGQKVPFAGSIAFFSVSSYVATTFMGVFVFDETLTLTQKVGLALGIVAIMLIG